MNGMIDKIKQYKNLILVAALAVIFIALAAADPLGYAAERAHSRAAIRNRMAIEKAEAEKEIAIIKARTEAELKQIELSVTVPPEEKPAFEEAGDDTEFIGPVQETEEEE